MVVARASSTSTATAPQEVVLGGDIYAGNPLGVPAGGLLWVLNGRNGARFTGYPTSLPGQTIWSSPAITDLDGDGWPDVVVGHGQQRSLRRRLAPSARCGASG